jgi:predicted RNA-binding Zn ribbon-like protein
MDEAPSVVSGHPYLDGNPFALQVNFVLMETLRAIDHVGLMGGHPALNLVDTVGGMHDQPLRDEDEFLRSYENLVELGLDTETLSERAARRLRREARERPSDAEQAYAAALEARAVVDAVFRPVAEGSEPPADALEKLAQLELTAISHGRLVLGRGLAEWSWEDAPRLDAPLWPLVHSAVELVTNGPLDRISRCGRCRWLFLDTTKNHSRRWCSTEGCGTDAKKERYVARRRARRAASTGG